jgi:eukaryotic-like serine/threonine-protein kinase
LVGRGAVADVYRAHTSSRCPVALKVLRRSHLSLDERLIREGAAQRAVNHPNVVRVEQVLLLQGRLVLVMEYLEGHDLRVFIQRRRPCRTEALSLFAALVSAAGAAHRRSIIHRDIKPENIMVSPTQGGMRPKLLDFGLAKVDDAKRLTVEGMKLGTPNYMAPEQITDASDVDARADLFSLGCILYELLSGRLAFDGPDASTVLTKIVSGRCTPIDQVVADLPNRICATVDALLATDRAHRPRDAAAVLLQLGVEAPEDGVVLTTG